MDYNKIGLKAGLEVHQQLDTETKLFCRCPNIVREKKEAKFAFKRYLRASRSEMGEIDEAAEEEERYKRTFIYKGYDSTCLVENDEKPPGELNKEAIDISLEIALLLNMNVVDEVHTMRKIVIDGSNTSGFQRTALIATDGEIENSQEEVVKIVSLCLEEEAAQKIEEEKETEEETEENAVIYSLDRLGVPLVEIGTAPDIRTPEQMRKVAEQIGMILRSTGKVKRGLGTIRQDMNISIEGGARVEIKGVQNLRLMEKIVRNEVTRQLNLIKIKDELTKRKAYVEHCIEDLSPIFEHTASKVIKKVGGRVFGSCLRGFSGILGTEIQPSRRFGTELADIASKYNVGLMHTDELPSYGISETEVKRMKEFFKVSEDDCVVIVAAEKEKAEKALKAVIKRAADAIVKIPEETRKALPDGCTAYMRPLPGAARMYPETDVPPVEIEKERLEEIKKTLPETLEHRKRRYMEKYGLNKELADKISRANFPLFEKIMEMGTNTDISTRAIVPPTLVARTLTDTLNELMHEGIEVESLEKHHFFDIFKMFSEGKFGKEAIPVILKFLEKNPMKSVEDATEEMELKSISMEEVKKLIEDVVNSKKEFVREKKERSVGPLMGLIMKQLRGKIDGREINKILKEKVSELLKNMR